MGQPLEWEGAVRGDIVSFGLNEPASGAVGISVTAALKEYYDTEQQAWVPLDPGIENSGTMWLIGKKEKGGKVDQKSVQALMLATGWSGDLNAVADGTWKPEACQFYLKGEEFKGTTTYKLSWPKPYDAVPGGGGNVSPERARELNNQYGSQLRALAGNTVRNSAPPAGKPSLKNLPGTPRRPKPPKDVDPNAELQPAAVDESGIPF